MAAGGELRVAVKLDYVPLLDQIGVIEPVAQLCYEEYLRGLTQGGGASPPWSALGGEQEAWHDMVRHTLRGRLS